MMKTHRSDRSATRRGRHGIVLFVAGALAMGLGVTGVHAALGGGSSSARPRPNATVGPTPAPSVAHAGDTRPVPLVIQTPPSPTPRPTLNPSTLGDGVYPTYIRAVDVRGATITVDVLQIFVGEAAHQAAIEDGVSWSWVQYDPVYIRNVNPLLWTLPVARDVHIKLIGVCVDPDRWVGLRHLREATTPFTTTFYYKVSVIGGSVERIRQLVAVAAC